MADERDPKVSQRYRELGDEAPSPELDRTILAAADRGRERPHAPLLTPAGRHRWYYAVGAAAILLLAVAVTVQIDRQQPDAQSPTPAPARESRKEVVEPSPPPPPNAVEAAPAPPAAQAPPKPANRKPQSQAAAREEAAARARVAGAADQAADTPERWIERIVELRKEGRDEEAQKQLAEFRKRYPDYTIPEAALR